MPLDAAELARRLVEADRRRLALRRATLEWQALDSGCSGGGRRPITLDLTDPTAVLLATAEALGRTGLDVAAYGGLVLASYGTPRITPLTLLPPGAVVAASRPAPSRGSLPMPASGLITGRG